MDKETRLKLLAEHFAEHPEEFAEVDRMLSLSNSIEARRKARIKERLAKIECYRNEGKKADGE